MSIWQEIINIISKSILNIINIIDTTTFVFVILIVIVTYFVANMVNKLIDIQVHIMSKKMNVDKKVYSVVRHSTVAVVYLLGTIIIVSSVPFLEKISVALLAGAGFAGIVVGLAAQNTLSNIISGISLAIFNPFRVGDKVDVMNEYGKIVDITLRHTVIQIWDNRRLIIPNSVIGDEAIINWSIEDPTVNWNIEIGIGYNSNIDDARKIMLEEAKNHKNVMTYRELTKYNPYIKKDDIIQVLVTKLGDYSVNLRLTFWCADRTLCFKTGCDLLESVKKRFDIEKIEIPYPYRNIVYEDQRNFEPDKYYLEDILDYSPSEKNN